MQYLIGLGSPGLNGIGCLRQLRAIWGRLKIVVLTGDDRKETIAEVLAAGADGYLLKGCSAELLRGDILKVHCGDMAFSRKVANILGAHFRNRKTLVEPLNDTEKEICARRERGQPDKFIASEMHMKISTLKTHKVRIRIKTLEAASLSEAAFLRRRLA